MCVGAGFVFCVFRLIWAFATGEAGRVVLIVAHIYYGMPERRVVLAWLGKVVLAIPGVALYMGLRSGYKAVTN